MSVCYSQMVFMVVRRKIIHELYNIMTSVIFNFLFSYPFKETQNWPCSVTHFVWLNFFIIGRWKNFISPFQGLIQETCRNFDVIYQDHVPRGIELGVVCSMFVWNIWRNFVSWFLLWQSMKCSMLLNITNWLLWIVLIFYVCHLFYHAVVGFLQFVLNVLSSATFNFCRHF